MYVKRTKAYQGRRGFRNCHIWAYILFEWSLEEITEELTWKSDLEIEDSFCGQVENTFLVKILCINKIKVNMYVTLVASF